jgi:hypothetical protein
MDPISAIGLGVQAAGGIVNFFANQSAAEKAKLLADENFKRWMDIQIPNPEDQKLVFKQLTSAGVLDPRLEQVFTQAPSAMNQVRADPLTQTAQLNALRSLQDRGFDGGLSLQDQAMIQDAQTQNQNQARGNSAAIMQNLAQRGASNSGFGVAAQLSNAQNAANQNASSGLNIAAAAQQRALDAIQGAGTMAGSMQAADLGQKNAVAKSNDIINNFNVQNAQGAQQRNIGYLNAAQAGNLSNAQRIGDANVGLYNDQDKYNKELLQQQFNNKTTQVQGANNAANGQAAAALQQGQNLGNFATNTANMVGGALATKGAQDYWTNYFDKQKAPAAAAPSAGSYSGYKSPTGSPIDKNEEDSATNPYGKKYY